MVTQVKRRTLDYRSSRVHSHRSHQGCVAWGWGNLMGGAHVTESDLPGSKRMIGETTVFGGRETTVVVVDPRKFATLAEEAAAVGKFAAMLKTAG